jgi:hypothetical protein
MVAIVDADPQKDFARAFGDALYGFLTQKGIKQNDAAKLFGLEDKHGKPNKARLNTYCHDSPSGKRPRPDAEILYLACTKLPGFYFDYKGHRISAATLNGHGARRSGEPAEQLTLNFDRQFNLTDEQGTVTVRVKRPPGRIEVSLSLKAKVS